MTAVVELESGQCASLELPQIDGHLSVAHLMELIRSKLGADPEARYDGIRSVSFLDSVDFSDNGDVQISDDSGGFGKVAPSIPTDTVDASPTAFASLTICGLSPWYSSLWCDAPPNDLHSLRSRHAGVGRADRPCSREVLNVRFENFARGTVDGIREYKTHGGGRVDQIQVGLS